MSDQDQMVRHLNRGFDQITPNCLDSILKDMKTIPKITSEEELFAAQPAASAATGGASGRNGASGAKLTMFSSRAVWGSLAAAACLVAGILTFRPLLFHQPTSDNMGVIFVDARSSVALAYNTNYTVTDVYTREDDSILFAEELKEAVTDDESVADAVTQALRMMDDSIDHGDSVEVGIISCMSLNADSESDMISNEEYFQTQVITQVQEFAADTANGEHMMICQNFTDDDDIDANSQELSISPGKYYFIKTVTEKYDVDLTEYAHESAAQLVSQLADQGIDIRNDFNVIDENVPVSDEGNADDQGLTENAPSASQNQNGSPAAAETPAATESTPSAPASSEAESSENPSSAVDPGNIAESESGSKEDITYPARPIDPVDPVQPDQPTETVYVMNPVAAESTEKVMDSHPETDSRELNSPDAPEENYSPTITEIHDEVTEPEEKFEETPAEPETLEAAPKEETRHDNGKHKGWYKDFDPTASGEEFQYTPADYHGKKNKNKK